MRNRYIFFLIALLCACSEMELDPSRPVVVNTNESATARSVKTYEVTFTFKDSRGSSLDNVYVYVDDGYSCLTGTTRKGKITFKVRSKSVTILATTRVGPKCGILTIRMTVSTNNTLRLPAFPKTEAEALAMINKVILTINTTLDLKDLYEFFKNLKKLNRVFQVGVPGVYSVSVLPYVDSSGRLVLGVDGILADPIFRMFPRLRAQQYVYTSI